MLCLCLSLLASSLYASSAVCLELMEASDAYFDAVDLNGYGKQKMLLQNPSTNSLIFLIIWSSHVKFKPQ